jgi:hypothetical protein
MIYEKDTIMFVVGVDKYSSIPPDGFPNRFAVLTWFNRDGSVPPWPLLRGAITQISNHLGADSVVAEYWRRNRKGLLKGRWEETKVREITWRNLMKSPTKTLINEGDFPDRIRFLKGDTVLLHEESERWDLVGGPYPYHDSCTLSFFSKTDISDKLRAIFIEQCSLLNIAVYE